MNLKLSEKYQVLTPNGWDDFRGVKQSQSPYLIKFYFDNKKSIKVTPDHQFIIDNKIYIANDLKVLDIIESKNGLVKIMNIEREIDEKKLFNVYDLFDVNNQSHAYYTNDIISHNCCDFILSGETVIEGEYINWIMDNLVKPPIEKRGQNEELWIWQNSIPNIDYIISADVAKGTEGDYSGFQVIRIDTFEQVAEYKSNKIDAERFGQMLCSIGVEYNNALLIPENNNFGQRTIQKILDTFYPNLFWYDKKFKGLVFPESQENFKLEQKEPGWPTSTKNRSMILENLVSLIRELAQQGMRGNPGGVIIRSSRLCYELKSWGYHSGRIDHNRGENDDLIVALAIGCFVKTVYSRIGENEKTNAIEFMKFFSNDKANIDTTFGIQNFKSRPEQLNSFLGEDLDWLMKD